MGFGGTWLLVIGLVGAGVETGVLLISSGLGAAGSIGRFGVSALGAAGGTIGAGCFGISVVVVVGGAIGAGCCFKPIKSKSLLFLLSNER